MSSIIHAITGEKRSSVHTITYEDVQVKSVVSSQTHSKALVTDATNKINALMSKLGSTHSQIDEYSRRRTDEISEAVKGSIEKIVRLTQVEQQQLLDDAQKQSRDIEQAYQEKLMV